jgi:Secretion system C-terminal sorting domain
MRNVLLLFLALCCWPLYTQAQITYEDFESGIADLPWVAVNGTYNGAVANPAPDAVNSSAFVGSYTTNEGSDFNFAIADLLAPADMSQYGLVKVKIWSPVAPSICLLKFEGSGTPVEMFQDITVANEWVEYSFDLTAGAANPTGLTKVLISFHSFLPGVTETFYWDDITGVEAKACYESFEAGNELPWNALDGAFEGPVDNPAPNSVNGSAMCGKYTKSGTAAYSLLLADAGTPFDLSILNQFTLQIYAPVPTQVLLKLEGTGGAIEQIKNIGLTNAWQEYTFDFSDAAANTELTKVILFFDPGVETSADDYYFDNLCAVPKGACTNATPNPDIIDDFECNRNATYVNGWDSLSVVDNPDPSTVNNSSKVGKYIDPQGEAWAALLIDYQNAMDLSTKNQFHAKVWSPKVTQILFKLEGGVSPAKEIWVDVTDANQWVEYTVDFSSEAAAGHKKITLFFNAGQDPEPGDIYYIDDIQWGEKSETVLEDFENGAFLPWEPLDQQTVLHGTFDVVANPAPDVVNESAMVGKYTKGTSAFSTVAAVAPGVIDISQYPQYNVDIWAPVGATTVTMQLESVAQGNKEVTRDLNNTGNWETVSFDFTDYQGITDWAAMKLIFNPGVAEAGAMFFFDNLTQGASTVDPCEGVVPISNIVDDFECQRNYDFGAGSDLLSVVANPQLTTVNSSTLVGKYEDQPNEAWAALCIDFPDGIDFSVYNQFGIMVKSEATVPVLYKLEGGSSPALEVWQDLTVSGEWEKVSVDFSSQAGMDHKRMCIFFNGGVDHPGGVEDYYIDNIAWEHAPFTSCIINFDQPAFDAPDWTFFENGSFNDNGFSIVDNPALGGINTSPKVGRAIEASDGTQPWSGLYTGLPAPIRFPGPKIIKMKVLMPGVSNVTMKLEKPLNPNADPTGDNTVTNTTSGEWEELEWNFSSVPDDADYTQITLIFNILEIPSSDLTYYFDDIRIGDGACITTGVFTPKVETMSISPNPVRDLLRVDNPGKVARLEIYNLLGRRVAGVWVGNDTYADLDVSNLPAGIYTLAGYARDGLLLGNAKFIKQ